MKASLIIGLAFVAVLLFGAGPVSAQFVWQPTNGGFFNTSGNWLPFGPPGAGQVAQFNSATTQTVILQTNTTLANHRFDNGNITYQLNQTVNSITGGFGLIVGGTVGQTGQFTILNGTMTGDMVVGNLAASTGFFTIGQDAVFDTGGIAGTEVGNSGNGSLTISSGGRYTGSAHLIVGALVGSNGTVTVDGSGSSLTSGVLDVGGASVGHMTVSNQGLVSAQAVNIGNSATGIGDLLVTGQGSTLNTNNQNLFVGSSGDGELAITSAGAVTSGASRIASSAGSISSAVISGADSTWNATSLAVGGALGSNGGAGTLQIADGGAVNVTGNVEVRSSANTALTIDGGTLNVGGNFTRLGTLNLLDGKLHVTGQFDNGVSALPITIDGLTPDTLPTLQLSGSSGVMAHVTSITVGAVNRGALLVDTGRLVNLATNSLLIGSTATGNGSVTVTGSSSTISTTQTISVGGSASIAQGVGSLTVAQNGATFSGTLNVFPQGTLTIDNGTVSTANLNISSGATVNFLRGRINLTAATTNLTAALLDGLLGTTHELGAGRTIGGGASTIALQTPLTINGGTVTSGSGGPLTNSSTLIVNSGTLNADATLTNDAGRTIQVSGTGIVTAGSILNNGTLLLNDNLVPTGGGSFTNIGVIRGSGVIGNAMSNPAAGQIQATTAHRLEFTNATFNNSGIVSVDGGELALTVGMNNNANGLISGRSGVIRGGTTGLLNTGAMAFSAGAMDVYGDVTQQTGGKITITGGGTTTFYDDVTINPGANNIQVSAVGSVVSSVVFLGSYNGGTTGGGAAFIEGDHRPGNSPALVSFGGDVFYGAGSKLNIELGGTARGSQYDAIDGAGALVLSGALNISLINGFSLAVGNSFTLLTAAGGVSGKFASFTLPAVPSGGQWSIAYNATSVVLAASLQGDYNHNGIVDAPDYLIWRKTLGQSGFALAADGNGNGLIDPGDFNVWRSQFGKPPGSGSDVSLGAAVPEPRAMVLGVAVVVSLSFGRGLRRQEFCGSR